MRAVPGSTQASADDNEESCLDPKEVRVRFWQVYSMNPNRVMSLHRLPPSCRGGILPLSMLGLWERMGSVTFSAPQHHLAGKARWSDGESPEAGETDRDSRGGVEQLEEKGHYWVTQLQSWELYFQLMYMFIHPSIHPSSTYLSIYPSSHPSSIHPSTHASFYQSSPDLWVREAGSPSSTDGNGSTKRTQSPSNQPIFPPLLRDDPPSNLLMNLLSSVQTSDSQTLSYSKN